MYQTTLLGGRSKIFIALKFSHHIKLMILDKSTNGLHPLSIIVLLLQLLILAEGIMCYIISIIFTNIIANKFIKKERKPAILAYALFYLFSFVILPTSDAGIKSILPEDTSAATT